MGFTRMVLRSLSEGTVLRRAIVVVMQVAAVLILLLGLLAVIQILKMSFQLPAAAATIGGVLVAILVGAAAFGISQIYLFRAQSVSELDDAPFTVIPIISVLFRAAGEAYAVGAVALGIGGCLFAWLSGMNPSAILSGMGNLMPTLPGVTESEPGGQSFVAGIVFLTTCIVAGFVALLSFYALSELVIVVIDIAVNVRRLAKGEAQPEPTSVEAE